MIMMNGEMPETRIPQRWDEFAICFAKGCVETPAPFFFAANKNGEDFDFQLCERCYTKLGTEKLEVCLANGVVITLTQAPKAEGEKNPSRKVDPSE